MWESDLFLTIAAKFKGRAEAVPFSHDSVFGCCNPELVLWTRIELFPAGCPVGKRNGYPLAASSLPHGVFYTFRFTFMPVTSLQRQGFPPRRSPM